MPETVTTCGVLLLTAQRELLLCHATGASHWDIPKGVADPGESPRETAVRETFEEAGLRLDPQHLLDLGRMAYRPHKDLHLFALRSERLDLAACVCTSQFRDRHGRLVPEADAFEWTPFDRVPERCAKSMTRVLTVERPLDEVWRAAFDKLLD